MNNKVKAGLFYVLKTVLNRFFNETPGIEQMIQYIFQLEHELNKKILIRLPYLKSSRYNLYLKTCPYF